MFYLILMLIASALMLARCQPITLTALALMILTLERI